MLRGIVQVRALQFNVAERQGHTAQALDLVQGLVQAMSHEIGLHRLIQVPQLPFKMAQRQQTLRLFRRVNGIVGELDGISGTADGLLKQTILALNSSDHGRTLRGALEASSQVKRLLGLTKGLGSLFQLAVVRGLDAELKGLLCR